MNKAELWIDACFEALRNLDKISVHTDKWADLFIERFEKRFPDAFNEGVEEGEGGTCDGIGFFRPEYEGEIEEYFEEVQ